MNEDRVEESMRRQLAQWREHLLDLSRRQKLLYFRHLRSASLEISEPAAEGVLNLVDGDRADLVTEGSGLVVADKAADELTRAGRQLATAAQTAFADRGIWTLHLGLGMLHWNDAADGRAVDSPLILIPVRLVRAAAHLPFRVKRAEEEVVLNPALVLKLERDFGIALPAVEEFSLDLPKYLAQVDALVGHRPGWSTSQRTVLTTFSFHKEAIYRDLEENEAQVIAHPLVQVVALGPAAPSARGLPFEPADLQGDIDGVVAPERLHSILDADSSQRRCILAARDGRSFVMDGPPGTGKSQTIANIIAELMAMGRSVLFVIEKAAALDVVHSRLQHRGLGNFLLELHSHTAGRKEVAQAFDKELKARPVAKSSFSAADESSLVDARRLLSTYAAAMNEVRPGLELSLHTVIGQVAALGANGGYGGATPETGRDLTAQRRARIAVDAERLARSWRPVSEGHDFLWRGLLATTADPATLARLDHLVRGARTAAGLLAERLATFDEDLPLGLSLDVAGAHRRLDLLRLLATSPTVPVHWFTVPDLGCLTSQAQRLRELSAAYLTAEDTARAILGDAWHTLDPETARFLDAAASVRSPWGEVTTVTPAQLRTLHDLAAESPIRAVALRDDVRKLATLFGTSVGGTTLRRAEELAALGHLAEGAALPEASWLNPVVHNALAESRRVLEQLVGVVRQRQDAVESTFTRAVLALDLVGLRTRFAETHTGLRRFSKAARTDRATLKAVTVAQRVTKETIAALDEAVEWQKAERQLSLGEDTHAARLGDYWKGTDTDFGRLSTAVDAALLAVQLAGDELDARSLASQISREGDPDPVLTATARRVTTTVDSWRGALKTAVGDRADDLELLSFEHLATTGVEFAEVLAPALEVVEIVGRVAGRDLDLAECRRGLAAVADAVDAQAALFDTYDGDRELLGPRHTGTDTDWDDVDSALEWCVRVRDTLGGPIAPVVAERLTRPTLRPDHLEEPLRRCDEAVSAFASVFEPGRAQELVADVASSLPAAAEVFAQLAGTLHRDVPEWCDWSTRRDVLAGHGLAEVVGALVSRGAGAVEVVREVEHAVLVSWIEHRSRHDDRLRDHRSDDRDALVERFRRLDTELVHNAHAAVVEACTRRRPRTVVGDAAVIAHEAQKKTRHISVRDLLTQAGTVAQQLKPCFMMSPLAVSQYLPAGLRFDVVIFDEASQVAPWDAVNCIYRGDQLIVAGDEKQLPPTSFFDSAGEEVLDDDGEEMFDDFESVLTQCKGAGAMTTLPLSWHYRSRHEDLITYSNVKFYEGELNTFPGARFESDDLGVASYLVPGVYDRGGKRDNVVEARQVVDLVVHHHREHPNLSVGVVALSTAQSDAVERELERRIDADPSLDRLLDRSDRLGGFFVKNLESVQGDERDIIILSIGYGPDAAGKVTMNFGPLTRKGGWRRLNVAVTRARRRVEVVTSLTHGQIVAGSNESHAALRDYLAYADQGPQSLAADLSGSLGDAESPFEEDVLTAVRSLGYEGVPQVGTAGYRVDIGVRHPDIPGEYVLGVECDGAAYHSAKAARDRDRLRQSVLEGLGWRIHRIWGLSWYRDRDGQVERLREALDDAFRGGPPPAPAVRVAPAEVVVEEVDLSARPAWAVPYERYSGHHPRTRHELHMVDARPFIRTYLEQLLRVEAPLHEDLILSRFRDDWGVGRMGSRIRANVTDVLAVCAVDGRPVVRTTRGFWSGGPRDDVRVPVPDQPDTHRGVGQVSPREVRLAVQHVVADAGSVSEADVVDTVRRVFGWGRTTGEITAAISSALNDLVQRGELQGKDSGRYAVCG